MVITGGNLMPQNTLANVLLLAMIGVTISQPWLSAMKLIQKFKQKCSAVLYPSNMHDLDTPVEYPPTPLQTLPILIKQRQYATATRLYPTFKLIIESTEGGILWHDPFALNNDDKALFELAAAGNVVAMYFYVNYLHCKHHLMPQELKTHHCESSILTENDDECRRALFFIIVSLARTITDYGFLYNDFSNAGYHHGLYIAMKKHYLAWWGTHITSDPYSFQITIKTARDWFEQLAAHKLHHFCPGPAWLTECYYHKDQPLWLGDHIDDKQLTEHELALINKQPETTAYLQAILMVLEEFEKAESWLTFFHKIPYENTSLQSTE